MAEEAEFFARDPHAASMARIFELAKIDFGRIDYGLLDGEVQVWEINTNPMITARPDTIAPLRLAGQTRIAEEITAAFSAIDSEGSGRRTRVEVPAAARRGLGRVVVRRIVSTASRWMNRGRKGRVWRALTAWTRTPVPTA